MRQDQPFIWKSSLGGPIVAWGRVSGDLQGRSNSDSQVDGVSNMAPACQLHGSVGGQGSEKGLLFSPIPDTSAFPCTPMVPFKLPPGRWISEGVSRSR